MNTSVLIANLWLIASFFAPHNTGGRSIWAYPRALMLAIAFLWVVAAALS